VAVALVPLSAPAIPARLSPTRQARAGLTPSPPASGQRYRHTSSFRVSG
jgi:hypothetical protein